MDTKHTALRTHLKEDFDWHGQRLTFLSMFIVTILTIRTVNLSKLAAALCSKAQIASNYKRLQRFFRGFAINRAQVAAFVINHLPKSEDGWVVTVDRTNWKLGTTSINFLVMGIVWGAITLPIVWVVLPKQGNSNTRERIDLLKELLDRVDSSKIAYLLADREFIGKQWFAALIDREIDFSIRVRENLQVTTRSGKSLPVYRLFEGLPVDQVRVLRKQRTICGCKLFISGCRLQSGEYLIVVSPHYAHHAIEQYAERWTIETLFGCLKSRGFNLEETHLREPERLERLFALLVIVTTWAYAVGEWLEQRTSTKLKNHGRRAMGIFRRGLNFLMNVLVNIDHKIQDFNSALSLLSCT